MSRTVSTPASAAPLTVIVKRRVRRGKAAEYERLMAGMQAEAARFPGHMGGFLIAPEGPEDDCYRTLFAFDDAAHLQAWTNSAERRQWLERIAPVTHGDTAVRVLSGLETWFALPSARAKTPPPRWKMALVTWMGIFPLVLLTSHTIVPLAGLVLGPTLSALAVTGVITGAMTWVVMPTLVRLLAGWLYPLSARS
jgi:antibiotic biosynthesis monooxygenase (ABM) superfamily enzyme